MDEHVAEQLYRPFRVRHREHGAAYINLPQGAQVRFRQQFPRLHEQVEQRWNQDEGVDLLRTDEGEHIQGGGVTGDDRFAAMEQDTQDAWVSQGEVMPQGEGGEQSGLVTPMVFVCRLHTAVVVVPMGTGDELGDAGGAAGQEQDGDAGIGRLGFHHRFRRHIGHLLHAVKVLDAVIGQVEPAVDFALDAGQLPNPVVGQHEDGHDLLQHQRQDTGQDDRHFLFLIHDSTSPYNERLNLYGNSEAGGFAWARVTRRAQPPRGLRDSCGTRWRK